MYVLLNSIIQHCTMSCYAMIYVYAVIDALRKFPIKSHYNLGHPRFHQSEEVGLKEEDEISAVCEVKERGRSMFF